MRWTLQETEVLDQVATEVLLQDPERIEWRSTMSRKKKKTTKKRRQKKLWSNQSNVKPDLKSRIKNPPKSTPQLDLPDLLVRPPRLTELLLRKTKESRSKQRYLRHAKVHQKARAKPKLRSKMKRWRPRKKMKLLLFQNLLPRRTSL